VGTPGVGRVGRGEKQEAQEPGAGDGEQPFFLPTPSPVDSAEEE